MKNGGGKSDGAKGGNDEGAGAGGGLSIEEELLKEGGSEGGDDGSENEADSEDNADESESGNDKDQDGDGEGGDAGEGGGKDGEEGSEDEGGDGSGEGVDGDDDAEGKGGGLRELFLAQNQQMQTLLKKLDERREEPKGWSDDQWAKVEEQTGVKKAGVQFLADNIIKPALKQVVDSLTSRLAKIESESVFGAMAQDPKYKDVHAYRGRMDKFLQNFAPEVRNNRAILNMAYLAAKGMGAKKAVADEGARREVRKKITTTGRPGAGGKGGEGAGGGKGLPGLTLQEKQAAKLGGMSEKEYAMLKRQKAKK